jgi:quercetin dioxygenase-like cupin family protein
MDITEYINSGILDLYVLGLTSDEENLQITALARSNSMIADEIDKLSEQLLQISGAAVDAVNPTVEPMVLAVINYTQRLQSGEAHWIAPELSASSTPQEFSSWTGRTDFTLPPHEPPVHIRIMSHTPEATTAVVWLKHGSPAEKHDDQYERFLVLEGTCDIKIDGAVHSLSPGDFLQIPLHLSHEVEVTSANYCKVILQRAAA